MSIRTTIRVPLVALPRLKIPAPPRLNLLSNLCQALAAYSRCVTIPYSVALGFDQEARLDRGTRDRDYDY